MLTRNKTLSYVVWDVLTNPFIRVGESSVTVVRLPRRLVLGPTSCSCPRPPCSTCGLRGVSFDETPKVFTLVGREVRRYHTLDILTSHFQ